jgi:hypothetical protein
LSWRLGPAEPLVISRLRNLEYSAGHRDRDTVGGEFTDQRVDYFGRTFSRAKYAAPENVVLHLHLHLHLQLLVAASQFCEFLLLRAGQPLGAAFSSASAWFIQFCRTTG